jgi:hypothetical protein
MKAVTLHGRQDAPRYPARTENRAFARFDHQGHCLGDPRLPPCRRRNHSFDAHGDVLDIDDGPGRRIGAEKGRSKARAVVPFTMSGGECFFSKRGFFWPRTRQPRPCDCRGAGGACRSSSRIAGLQRQRSGKSYSGAIAEAVPSSPHQRAIANARSGRSEINPSTPHPISRLISAGRLTVQGSTSRPSAWAW